MGALISKVFPCTATPGEEGAPTNVVVKITSTSACCRGQLQTITIPSEDISKLKDILDDFKKRYSVTV